MNIVWIRKSISEWISINIDEIKSFSYVYEIFSVNYLYINNEPIVRDDELILFEALEKLFKGGRGSKYPFDNSIQEYNIQVYNESIKGVSDD